VRDRSDDQDALTDRARRADVGTVAPGGRQVGLTLNLGPWCRAASQRADGSSTSAVHRGCPRVPQCPTTSSPRHHLKATRRPSGCTTQAAGSVACHECVKAPPETIKLDYVHHRPRSATAAARTLASAPSRWPAEAGAPISWPRGRRTRSALPSPDAGEPRPSEAVAGLDPDASFWANPIVRRGCGQAVSRRAVGRRSNRPSRTGAGDCIRGLRLSTDSGVERCSHAGQKQRDLSVSSSRIRQVQARANPVRPGYDPSLTQLVAGVCIGIWDGFVGCGLLEHVRNPLGHRSRLLVHVLGALL
jgi:hypothetical protein